MREFYQLRILIVGHVGAKQRSLGNAIASNTIRTTSLQIGRKCETDVEKPHPSYAHITLSNVTANVGSTYTWRERTRTYSKRDASIAHNQSQDPTN
jgi:hypothetical protein